MIPGQKEILTTSANANAYQLKEKVLHLHQAASHNKGRATIAPAVTGRADRAVGLTGLQVRVEDQVDQAAGQTGLAITGLQHQAAGKTGKLTQKKYRIR